MSTHVPIEAGELEMVEASSTLIRWLEFGCFAPLLHSHGRFEQEAWTYDCETVDLYPRARGLRFESLGSYRLLRRRPLGTCPRSSR